MRVLIELIAIIAVYYAIKTVLRSAFRAYHEKDGAPPRLEGKEMVLDPECRTYVVKDRALIRQLGGRPHFFCSEACARRYEERQRG